MSTHIFSERKELLEIGRLFIKHRLDSLQNDVKRCLAIGGPFQTHSDPAAFPAILYCFSTIDLLGAILAGNASRTNRNTTEQSSSYMRRFMRYTEEQTRLLQNLFRHKLVHLAQPKSVVEDEGRKIGWRYSHDDVSQHLKLTRLSEPLRITISSGLEVEADHEFSVSIAHFANDIRDSVENPEGYLATLESDIDLQDRFERAFAQIHKPND